MNFNQSSCVLHEICKDALFETFLAPRAMDRGHVTTHLGHSYLPQTVSLLAPPRVTSPQSGLPTGSLMNEDMLTAVCSVRLVRRGQKDDQLRLALAMFFKVLTIMVDIIPFTCINRVCRQIYTLIKLHTQ